MSRRGVEFVLWTVLIMAAVWSLARPAANLPGNSAWLRRFQTPDVSRRHIIAQEFVMRQAGLQTIELHPVPNGETPAGDIQLTLVDITDGLDSRVVRSVTIAATRVARTAPYRFDFAPVAESLNRKYRFELTATDSSGFRLLATKGDRYREGTLTYNGTSRWADLVFQASIPTRSIAGALWSGQIRSAARGRFLLALLAVNVLLIGVLVRAMSSSPR